ncbi:hypothetical protein PVL29_018029 [Vitis rotundifolia]|uniref:Uncharacterized protein n=1 Tax=Vitis rotundifolia TaxID=103349 RepID=A0AA39DFF1_VITRO|nr:hypothetical protein PVL29_018029 [Vitis rotundifolia]
MACLVCISFSLPLAASQTLIEEKNQRKSTVGRLSSQATTRTGMKLLIPITSDRSISSVEDWSFLPHKMAPGRRFWEPVSLHLNVVERFSMASFPLPFWMDLKHGKISIEA